MDVEDIRIIDLQPDDDDRIGQAAGLLFEGFKEYWPHACPDIDSALTEVQESFVGDRISRAALDGNDRVLGWIGGISEYHGKVWEVHPLVVRPNYQRRGIGRALVADLEERVRERGGVTIRAGTDDEDDMTTLSGVDLYPDVLGHVGRIRNLRGHPYEFYQKVGFVLVGAMPDANGPGKPDIYLAKSVLKRSES